MIYGAMELFLGLRNHPSDNIAHFAHLGGMVAGYIILSTGNRIEILLLK